MERRDFLKTATAATVAAATGSSASASAPVTRPETPGMIYRNLGTTGERVSAIGLGGFHIGKQPDPADSIRLIRTAIDRGITFMDNCWDYNDGISEVRMGQALRDGYRAKVFLMTKIDGRTKVEYNKQLEQSMGRLQTDVIDLVQFHEIIRMEDPDRIFAEDGATRIPPSISACSKWPSSTTSTSTPFRCPSTSWTPTSAPSPTRSCRSLSSRVSASSP
jgi:hypothetical protein